MTQIEEVFRDHFNNNRTDDRILDLLHATDAVREFIASETNRQRISLPHWCNLAKLDQVYGNKGVFERFCRELQEDLDAAKAKIEAEKADPTLKEINDLKDQLADAQQEAKFSTDAMMRESRRADYWRAIAEKKDMITDLYELMKAIRNLGTDEAKRVAKGYSFISGLDGTVRWLREVEKFLEGKELNADYATILWNAAKEVKL